MRVLVCGGRDFSDYDLMLTTLNNLPPDVTIIHGAAPGADSLADRWAHAAGHPTARYPADWATHGRAAGPIRNRQMLTDGKPDIVIAFPGGRGTANMVRQAKASGVKVIEVVL